MATLIAVYNSDGCVGRCDARCHEAHQAECDCICGGLNHGAGRMEAEENTRELAGKWVEEYEKRTGKNLGLVEILGRLSTPGAVVVPEPGQRTMHNPRNLTARQRSALKSNGIVNSHSGRTLSSLLRRGLLEPNGAGIGYAITPIGQALLASLRA